MSEWSIFFLVHQTPLRCIDACSDGTKYYVFKAYSQPCAFGRAIKYSSVYAPTNSTGGPGQRTGKRMHEGSRSLRADVRVMWLQMDHRYDIG